MQREKERAVHDNNAKLERIKTQVEPGGAGGRGRGWVAVRSPFTFLLLPRKVSLRASAIITVREQQRRHLMWECGCLRTSEEVWLACGERQHGKIGIITADESFSIEIPKDEVILAVDHVMSHDLILSHICCVQVASRVMCIHHVKSCDIMLLGTLDFVLHAIDCTTRYVITPPSCHTPHSCSQFQSQEGGVVSEDERLRTGH